MFGYQNDRQKMDINANILLWVLPPSLPSCLYLSLSSHTHIHTHLCSSFPNSLFFFSLSLSLSLSLSQFISFISHIHTNSHYVLLSWLDKNYNFQNILILILKFEISISGLKIYPLASEANRGVYWNQAQKNLTHPYTEYPWVSVTLWLCGHYYYWLKRSLKKATP